LAVDKHIRFKEDTAYNQEYAEGFIMVNGYESKIANLIRQEK